MKITSIINMAKRKGYEINMNESHFMGDYENVPLKKLKFSIENDRYVMKWETTQYENETLNNMNAWYISIDDKKEPNEYVSDFFTTEIHYTIKGAFKEFEGK